MFSFVGYKTVKAAIKNGKFYNIKLQEDTKVLDEVVVVGYGSMRKKEVTGAVARVNSEEITKISTSDLGTALQGMVLESMFKLVLVNLERNLIYRFVVLVQFQVLVLLFMSLMVFPLKVTLV